MSEIVRQPRIVEAANRSVLQATLIYSSLGYSVIPLRGKKPALSSWEQLQHRRADGMQISQWHKARLLSNVGIICGDVSGNLVVMDLDGIGAIAAFELVFPQLLNTFAVLTGSGQGKHYYYQVDNLPPTTRVMNVPYAGANLEMRADGCYVVAPPSIHPDTERKYRVTNAAPVMHLPDLDQVKRWLYGFIAAKQPAPARRPADRDPDSKVNPALLRALTNHFQEKGYRLVRDGCLLGQCVYPGRHKHGDANPSFIFNPATGYGWCWVCKSIRTTDICKAIGLDCNTYGGLWSK